FPYYGGNNLKTSPAAKSYIVENKTLYCHPCSKLGYVRCPKGHFRCMNELKMEEIADIIKNLWMLPNLA
ncbi:MAG: hypothetical protein EOP49_18035, partial [Sphingobacteriales bacterium]